MTQQEKSKIVEWLYLNDKQFDSKLSWRKEFMGMLDGLVSDFEKGAAEFGEKFESLAHIEQSNLKHLKTIQLSKTSGKDLISKSSKVFKSYIDSDFTNWGLNKTQSPTEEMNVDVLELAKDSTFKEMFTNPEKQVMTQSQIISFCQNHVQDLRQGYYETFFLIKVNGKYFVVRVSVDSGGLRVRVGRFEDDYVWLAGYLHHVVVPPLIS